VLDGKDPNALDHIQNITFILSTALYNLQERQNATGKEITDLY
jgi:hypothetical protein